jgi:hypothetical protein
VHILCKGWRQVENTLLLITLRGRLSRGRPLAAGKDRSPLRSSFVGRQPAGASDQGEVKWVDRGGDDRRPKNENERWTNWMYNFLEHINSFRKLYSRFPKQVSFQDFLCDSAAFCLLPHKNFGTLSSQFRFNWYCLSGQIIYVFYWLTCLCLKISVIRSINFFWDCNNAVNRVFCEGLAIPTSLVMWAYQELKVGKLWNVQFVCIKTTRQLVNIYRRFGGAWVSSRKSWSILFFLDCFDPGYGGENILETLSFNLQVRLSPAALNLPQQIYESLR